MIPASRAVYYLFHRHHWTPETYYGMGQGGRDLTLALALHEAESTQNTPLSGRRAA